MDYADCWGDSAHAYMWNSNMSDEAVHNKPYPGEPMYKAAGLTDGFIHNGQFSMGSYTKRVNGVFFDEKYTKVIFCSSQNSNVDKTGNIEIGSAVFKTQRQSYEQGYGIYITKTNVYFDFISKRWVTDVNDICSQKSDFKNFRGDDSSLDEPYYYCVNDSTTLYATRCMVRNSTNTFTVYKSDGKEWVLRANQANYFNDDASGKTATLLLLGSQGAGLTVRTNTPQTGIYTFKISNINIQEGTLDFTAYYGDDGDFEDEIYDNDYLPGNKEVEVDPDDF